MPTIGEALAEGEQSLFLGRAAELAIFERWLTRDPRPPEILEVSGPGGIGKTSLLSAFHRVANREGRKVIQIDLRDVGGRSTALLPRLGGDSPEQAADALNHSRPVVLLDTFEEAGQLQEMLAETLLPRLETAVKVVVAGRQRLSHGWRLQSRGRVAVHTIGLGSLGTEAARTYLSRRGLTDERLVEQILHLVGGHPLALSLAADLVLHTGVRNLIASPERHLLIRSLAEQLLGNVTDPRLREVIEASAIVQQFDEPTLAAIAGVAPSAAAFEQLCRLSVVRPAQHGLALHDEVRRILANDLRWRDKQRYDQLRLRALAHYRERMSTARAEDREWLLAERLYLWEHAFVQTMLFGQDDNGEIYVEPGEQKDETAALEIEMIWHTQILPTLGITHYEIDPKHDVTLHEADMRTLLGWSGRRLSIARDPEGQALGFSLVVPISAQNADYMVSHRVLGPLLRAYSHEVGPGGLPINQETSRISYFVQATHKGVKPEAVTAALWRDVFSVFTREGVVLITVGLPEHKELFRTLGFERMPGEYEAIWGMSEPTEAYKLDLEQIGLEAWTRHSWPAATHLERWPARS